MKIGIINNLNEKIEPCDIIILLSNPIPKSVKSSVVKSEMWLVKDFSNWINNLQCSHCIGSYFEFSEISTPILDRLYKSVKYKFEIIQDKEFNIITENQVVKFWIGKDYEKIPKNCDIVIVNDIPDERTITQTRKKTDGNVELAKYIKEKLPQVVIYPSNITSKLESKKNCITKFASIANNLYFNYD